MNACLLPSKNFGGRPFTVREACQAAGISSSSFHRLVEWALQTGEVEITGEGKATRYTVRAGAKARSA